MTAGYFARREWYAEESPEPDVPFHVSWSLDFSQFRNAIISTGKQYGKMAQALERLGASSHASSGAVDLLALMVSNDETPRERALRFAKQPHSMTHKNNQKYRSRRNNKQ